MLKQIIISIILISATATVTIGQSQSFADATQSQTFRKEKSNTDILIYPNPATDFFAIKNDLKVSTVVIYNIIGKAIQTNQHSKGKVYSVEDLRKGFYIVRLFDDKNKVIKVLRLNRSYGA